MNAHIIMAAAALLLLSGCKPEDPGHFSSVTGLGDVTLSATQTAVATVSFEATAQWVASRSQSWITIDPMSGGAGSNSVSITAAPNSGKSERSATVSFICGAENLSMTITQSAPAPDPGPKPDPGPDPVPDGPYLTDPYSSGLHFSTGRLRTTSAVMQSFDLDLESGEIYYSQLNSKFRAYLSCGKPNSDTQPPAMTLNYFGHVSNFSLEKGAFGKKYIWVDNFSSKNASGDYWGSTTVSRIEFRSAATISSWQAEANYFFGENNISVAVDPEGDMLTILGISSGRFRTYRLSELNELPIVDITIPEVTYGGEDKAPDPLTTKSHVVKGRDCTKVKPIGDFTILRGQYPDGVQISWQGFDIDGGLIYQAQGNGHEDGTPSPGWLQVRKIDGTVVLPLTPFRALEDLGALKDAGITDIGYMEPEGVKVYGNYVYCGFASKNSKNERRGTIFRYSKALVKQQ